MFQEKWRMNFSWNIDEQIARRKQDGTNDGTTNEVLQVVRKQDPSGVGDLYGVWTSGGGTEKCGSGRYALDCGSKYEHVAKLLSWYSE